MSQMHHHNRKNEANRILYEFGLLDCLQKFGNPHMVGSYRMDLMTWNDLDIDVEYDEMSLNKLHHLTAFILQTFQPTWYEAKEEKRTSGETVWFHGFETIITGELWNVDIWFFSKSEIENAELFCDKVQKQTLQNTQYRKAIMDIKTALQKKNLYGCHAFSSMDVYHAVLDENVLTVEKFLQTYLK